MKQNNSGKARAVQTAKAWLVQQPQIEIVARDRGGGYAQAATQALPHADQVADRWHLMENASHAFLDAVRKSMRQIVDSDDLPDGIPIKYRTRFRELTGRGSD